MDKRSCGTCTKCCEGWLSGEALGHKFFPGKPCHFISIGKGCSVYPTRPKDPCVSYKCAWLTNLDIPEWMKPSEIHSIIDIHELDGHSYISIKEAGSPMQARVLSWFFQYILKKGLNAIWEVDGGFNWAGSKDFNKIMDDRSKLTTMNKA